MLTTFFPPIHICGVVQSALNEFLFLDDTIPTSGILKQHQQHLRSKHQQHRTSNSSVGGPGSQVSIEDVTDEDEYYHYGAGNSRRKLSEGSVNPYSKHHSPPPAYLVDLPEDQVEGNSLLVNSLIPQFAIPLYAFLSKIIICRSCVLIPVFRGL